MNIFILDFDDTLYPTSWIHENTIKQYENYKLYFLELDNSILNLLKKINVIGYVYIVTNATYRWINISLQNLPYTKKFIDENNIEIISARQQFENTNITNNEWKKYVFKNIVDSKQLYMKNNEYLNIISFGDANYEYYALINLNEYLNDLNCYKFFLKNIKFIGDPSFKNIVEQIEFIQTIIVNVTNNLSHVDLIMKPNENT